MGEYLPNIHFIQVKLHVKSFLNNSHDTHTVTEHVYALISFTQPYLLVSFVISIVVNFLVWICTWCP